MAAHNIDMFEEGNSSSHTETTNSNTPPFMGLADCGRLSASFLVDFSGDCYGCRLEIVLSDVIQVEDESHCELEEILTDRNRINSQKKLDPCESRCLCLKFSHEIAPVVFTGECIFADGTKLELVDAVTGQQVRHGALASSAQVEIFVLDDENWTIEELNNHIMVQTRGGTSRRNQNPYLRLEGGVVSVNEIKFKHTPKHMKKLNVVKLGARVVDQPEVIEAVTGPFTVKDKRSKSKKRYPPSPTHDVWRLEHIYNNGAFHKRLTENGIKTVEDFLIELQNNPQRLRHANLLIVFLQVSALRQSLAKACLKIIGKKLQRMLRLAILMEESTCTIIWRRNKNLRWLFDAAGQVMWLDSGCGLLHFNMLRDTQKAYAQKLVEIAFANWETVEKSDNEISINVSPSPRIGGMSRCHLGNLVTVDECQSLEFQNPSGTNRWIDSAEFSTSYAIANRQSVSVAITSPGHSGLGNWEYLNSPNNITSAISEPGDSEEYMQYLSSIAIQFDDFSYRELGQTNNSAAETSATQFHGLQHGETMDLSHNEFMVSENVHTFINEDGTNTLQRQMNNVSLVPEASLCKDEYKKSWIKISSILKCLVSMNDILMPNSEDLGTHKSNSEDELLFSSPTMKKMLEVMVIQTFNRVLKPTLEKLIRNVVKHELELAEKKFLFTKGNPEKDIQAPKPKILKLMFRSEVSVPVLTGKEIKGEGGNAIELVLVDDNTGKIVESGPEASAKVEIVVLRGEFGDDDGGNWTVDEFDSNVLREREGKKPLLAETVHVRLNKGIGSVDKIKFSHSKFYMKMGMFRLGARIVDTFNSIQVKEARTESFTVKDGRQQYHEKHDPPSLSDGVHRLKNIGRCSMKRLWNENVHTVEDFLILLLKDRERLKCVLNLKPKMLEETISHAQRCITNERTYSYIDLQEKEGVVFNIVGEANAQRLLISACENWDHVVPVDNETFFMQYPSQILPTMNSLNSPSREVPSTSNGIENFRTSDGHCSTSFQHNVSSVIPARVASAISQNDPDSVSISYQEFSNSPIYSPLVQHFWIDQCNYQLEDIYFVSDTHQPHDASASTVNVHNRWKMLLKIFRQSSMRRRAAALTDIQPLKKQRVF
ncbi:hypothetical protein H5410_018134 [Solanum commersonii]|uniref:Calmodulin binding protein n=1 Tax=Solanum commersonii TaxID=4109 RepID=A0A9J6A129_SOLCO|nr:hypothetical protein H5410_018134 [Solanum commersonii]